MTASKARTSKYTLTEDARLAAAALKASLSPGAFQHRATMDAVRAAETAPVVPAPAPKPVPPKVDLTRDHVGISITGAGPADVERLLTYGAWARTGREECWDPKQFAAFMVEAKKQGLKVLSCVMPCQPRFVDWTDARFRTFGDYTAQIADLGVDAIEAGNEANNAMFNDGDLLKCAALGARLARAVKAAVSPAHPSLPVITCGWSPAGAGPTPLYPQQALADMFKADPDLAVVADGYSYHAYEMSMKPSMYSPNPGWNACGHLTEAWAAIVASGASKIRASLWLTEFGYHGTDANQEAWLRDYFHAFAVHRKAGVQIANVYWHTLFEGQSTVSEAERTMGLLRQTAGAWVEKPAAVALREIGATPWT